MQRFWKRKQNLSTVPLLQANREKQIQENKQEIASLQELIALHKLQIEEMNTSLRSKLTALEKQRTEMNGEFEEKYFKLRETNDPKIADEILKMEESRITLDRMIREAKVEVEQVEKNPQFKLVIGTHQLKIAELEKQIIEKEIEALKRQVKEDDLPKPGRGGYGTFS